MGNHDLTVLKAKFAGRRLCAWMDSGEACEEEAEERGLWCPAHRVIMHPPTAEEIAERAMRRVPLFLDTEDALILFFGTLDPNSLTDSLPPVPSAETEGTTLPEFFVWLFAVCGVVAVASVVTILCAWALAWWAGRG